MLVLAYLRKGGTFAEAAAGFEIGTTTAWRYVNETVALLAACAPKLRQAVRDAATITPQDTRARLRMERCFSGDVYVVTAPLPAPDWPYELAYEWGQPLKALFSQRAC